MKTSNVLWMAWTRAVGTLGRSWGNTCVNAQYRRVKIGFHLAGKGENWGVKCRS